MRRSTLFLAARRLLRGGLPVLAIAACCAWPTPACAGPFYSVNARAAGQDSFTSGPDPAQRSNSVTGVFGQISNAFAAAGPGVLKGSSSASFPTAGLSPPVGTLSIGAAGSGSANFRLDDMVVGGVRGQAPYPFRST